MEVEVVLVWHCVMLLLGREPLVIVSLHSGACLELGSWHVKCCTTAPHHIEEVTGY